MLDWLHSNEVKKLREAIKWQLANVADDLKLRDALEAMAAASTSFNALAWFWGPLLYARNKVLFRPFILHHFAEHRVDDKGRWHPLPWQGDIAKSLDPWLAQVQQAEDASLFKRLYLWKHRKDWRLDEARWRSDLLAGLQKAATPAAQAKQLTLFDMPAVLDEPTASKLHALAPQAAEKFILNHLPHRPWRGKPEAQWKALRQTIAAKGQKGFASQLYRRQVSREDWHEDVLALMKSQPSPEGLCTALEEHHPIGLWENLGKTFHALLDVRGLDAMPYVRKHLRQVYNSWRRDADYDRLVALADWRGWVEFSAALVLVCGTPDDFNKAIKHLLDEKSLGAAERLRRLALLSGVSREWNGAGWGLAVVHPLDEANALALHARYPQLLREQFLANLTPNHRNLHFGLFEKAWNAGDDTLAHFLASRYITNAWLSKSEKQSIDSLVADRFVALKLDDLAFARKAAAVLSLVPAFSIYNYDRLIAQNRLARLLFERSLKNYLAVPEAVGDLVEGSEIHVQHLAYRVLGLPGAEALAVQNLPVLIGTLLRPLHRRTRLAAFAALRNAASTEAAAKTVLVRAREAFALPDKKYPKEQLVGLIGHILGRWPALAETSEQTPIYRRAA